MSQESVYEILKRNKMQMSLKEIISEANISKVSVMRALNGLAGSGLAESACIRQESGSSIKVWKWKR